MSEVNSLDAFVREMERPLAMCFSGHRPEKLPGKGDSENQGIRRLKSIIQAEIIDAVKNQRFKVFYIGMSRGVDLWAGKFVAELKADYPDIKIVCAFPYRDFTKGFKGEYREACDIILKSADSVVYVCEEYNRLCMRKRNEFMVINSDRLLAVYDPRFPRSGTEMTINIARKNGVPAKIINIEELMPILDTSHI